MDGLINAAGKKVEKLIRFFILLGDPAQLLPVADKPLYHSKPTTALGEQGHLACLMFSKVIKFFSQPKGARL